MKSLLLLLTLASSMAHAGLVCGKITKIQNTRRDLNNKMVTMVSLDNGKSVELEDMAAFSQPQLATALASNLNVCFSNDQDRFGWWQISSMEK